MAQKSEIVQLEGGLDLITPKIGVGKGFCISAKNYEPSVRGYRRCDGYERFDGRAKPSDATYSILDFDAGIATISSGDTVTGATSGATGVAVADAVVETGSYGASDATGYVPLTEITGVFADNEWLQVGAVNKLVLNGLPTESAAPTVALHRAYLSTAVESRRALISALPGSGPVLGVHTHNGDVYGFRDDVGATMCVMHKASAAGWVAQTFGKYIKFDAGTVAYVEGEALTGGTSGATATIKRIVLQSGTWSGSDAAGYLVLSSVTGSFVDNEALTGGTAGASMSNGLAIDISLPAGGRVRAISHNFYGASNYYRMYATTSEGYAFEWDGTTLTPIFTGVAASIEKPKYIGVHAQHLLLGYDGGAVMHSGTGLPLSFMALDGAGEIGLGETITGILSAAAKATAIFGETMIGYLTGSSIADFNLEMITRESGAKSDTAIMLTEPVFLDKQGIRGLSTSQAFGDWKRGTLSRIVQPYFEAKRATSINAVAAHEVRNKDQYRVYFENRDIMTMYLGRKNAEFMPFSIGFTPTCAISGEDANDDEILLCGDDAGMIYQMDVGTSFDGANIEAVIRFPWWHMGRPNTIKRYHRMELEFDGGNDDTSIITAVEYSYADPDFPSAPESVSAVDGSGGLWDAANWDEFVWGNSVQGSLIVELNGIGRNLSAVFISDTKYETPHVLSSTNVKYTLRRERR